MATAMWRNQPPITGARINGSRERAGIAACFNDSEGKPLAIQLGANDWIPALKLLGFHESMVEKGLDDLGISFESDEKKNQILDQLSVLFGTNKRDHWVGLLREADMVAAPVNSMLEASEDPNMIANGYVQTMSYPNGENLKIHGTPWKLSETPSKPGIAPELGAHNKEILNSLGYDDQSIEHLKEIKAI